MVESAPMTDGIGQRALELAMTANILVQKLDDRMTRHEEECSEERREAAKNRHDFRAEMALTLSGMRNELRNEIGDLKTDFVGAVRALGTKLDTFHAENRESNDSIERSANKTEKSALIAVIAILCSISGAALTRALGWW